MAMAETGQQHKTRHAASVLYLSCPVLLNMTTDAASGEGLVSKRGLKPRKERGVSQGSEDLQIPKIDQCAHWIQTPCELVVAQEPEQRLINCREEALYAFRTVGAHTEGTGGRRTDSLHPIPHFTHSPIIDYSA